jgi:GntR family transcriptional regulator
MDLDKKSFTPLYYQLADLLREKIHDGSLTSGMALPSEFDLIDEHNISRGTVREALRLLEQEGIIEKRKGVGTFVSAPKIEHETDRPMGFSRVMQMTGKTATAQLLEMRKFLPSHSISETLGLSQVDSVYLVKRLRFADEEPLLLEYSYFREDVGEKLLNQNLTKSIYSLMEGKFGLILNRSVNTVEAQLAKEEEAALLGVETGSPVLVLKRIVYFDEETPFEYAKDIYRADRTKFKIRTHKGQLIEKSPIENF